MFAKVWDVKCKLGVTAVAIQATGCAKDVIKIMLLRKQSMIDCSIGVNGSIW